MDEHMDGMDAMGGMDPTETEGVGDHEGILDGSLSRRTVLKSFGAGAVALGAGRLAGPHALGASERAVRAAKSGTIVIGYVTPQTGALAGFAQPDPFVLGKVRASSLYKNGIKIGGRTYKVVIKVVDSQSNPTRAAQVAQNLILQNHADLIVTSSAPETTNPVATTCQQLRVPCVSTVVPWEAWYAGLGGNPLKPTKSFQYVTTFFFGMKEFAGCFLPMWNRIEKQTHAAKIFGGMFPNDADGNAFRAGFPPFAAKMGYKFIDGGAYTDLTTNYSSMISKFKSSGVEFFTNAPLPPDFNTFWKQAVQQGFRPKLATVAKVLLFPSDVNALGALANNIATDAWWTPYHPYRSSLTGETAQHFATDYQVRTGNEWVQSMGSTYSLFEVAAAALKKVSDPHDKAAVAHALHSLSYKGMCGPINFNKGPAPGVGIIKPVGIQWKPGKKVFGKKFPWQPYVVDNTLNKAIPITGDLVPTNK